MNATPIVPSGIVRALFDAARDGLLALNEDGTIVDANETAAARLGRLRRYVIGKPFAAFVALDDRRRFRSALTAARPGRDETVELELNGAPATVALRALPRLAPRTIAVTIYADPAAARLAETAIDRTFTIARLLLRLPHAVVVMRSGLRVAFANQRARQLLGQEAVRVGRPFSDQTAGGELHALADRLVEKHVPVAAKLVQGRDGRFLRATGIPAHGDEPAVLVVEDVTQEHLRDRVMREFVRNAAHQLRTPLTGIAAAVEVLQSGAKESRAERDRFLEHIEQQSERLSRLARGLLMLARAQSGETMRLEFVELKPLLETLAHAASAAPGVKVVSECPPRVAALAEPDLVHEALSALVDNAVSHTVEGEIRLSASEADGTVAIEVSDTGAGILPEQRERIFDPFYRSSSSGDGYGLGLAIAAQAVEAMHGTIEPVDVAVGTRFAIRLPSARVIR